MVQAPSQPAATTATPADASPANPEPVWGQVRVANVNVRWGPGAKHGIITVLHGGDFVRILERTDGWYRIEWPRSAPAWVCTDFVRPDGRVTGDRVRIRAGGTPASPILAHVSKDDRVEVLDSVGNWYKITPPSNAQAYIFAKLVIPGVVPPEGSEPVRPQAGAEPAAEEEPSSPPSTPPAPAEESARTTQSVAATDQETQSIPHPPASVEDPVDPEPEAAQTPQPITEAPEQPVNAMAEEEVGEPDATVPPAEPSVPADRPVERTTQPEIDTPAPESPATTTPRTQEEAAAGDPQEATTRPAEASIPAEPTRTSEALPAPTNPTPDETSTGTVPAREAHAAREEPTTKAMGPTLPDRTNHAPRITFVRAGPAETQPVSEGPPAESGSREADEPSPARLPTLPPPEQDLEDEDPALKVHTPVGAGDEPDPASRHAMETLLEEVPSAAMVRPITVEPHFIVVPVEVRATADRDEFGELLPPPRFVRDRTAPKEVSHAPAAPGLLSTSSGLRASAPLVFRLPGRADLSEEFIFLNGKLQAATDAGATGHRLISGQTTLVVRSADPRLSLAPFVGRHVEILARCGSKPHELQVTALHPID